MTDASFVSMGSFRASERFFQNTTKIKMTRQAKSKSGDSSKSRCFTTGGSDHFSRSEMTCCGQFAAARGPVDIFRRSGCPIDGRSASDTLSGDRWSLPADTLVVQKVTGGVGMLSDRILRTS